jgi:hypothetical protein
MAPRASDRAFLSSVNRLDAALRKADAIGKDAEALCTLYHKTIRPLLLRVLPIVQLIPIYGKTIAKAIRFLMKIADLLCGAAARR